jgi:hypothetical protein
MLNDSPAKSLLYVTTFLFLTPIALITSIFALTTLTPPSKVLAAKTQKNILFASLPNTPPSLDPAFEVEDARPEILKEYLSYYQSPLIPYSKLIVETSDKYGFDFRLLTAIAQQESNLCKKIPLNSHNCWGWGIHSQGTLYFSSYKEAIETVAEGLKENYINQGYASVDEIMNKWVPQSPERAWAKGVNTFMSEME